VAQQEQEPRQAVGEGGLHLCSSHHETPNTTAPLTRTDQSPNQLRTWINNSANRISKIHSSPTADDGPGAPQRQSKGGRAR